MSQKIFEALDKNILPNFNMFQSQSSIQLQLAPTLRHQALAILSLLQRWVQFTVSHFIQHLALVKMTWHVLSPGTTGTPSLWSPPSSAATCPSPRWGSVNILAVKCSQHSKLGKYFKQWNGNRHFFMFSDYERSGDSVAVFRAETKNHRCASHPSHRGAESGKTYNQNIFPWAR